MIPPEDAGQRLLLRCPIPPQLLLERIVQAQLRRNQAESESQSLCFEVKSAFAALSPKNFGSPGAGARLVISLLQGLAWRRYAALVQETQGRLQPASCQWYKGVRGTGSFCHREIPATLIAEPQECTRRECFAPFRTVSLPHEDELPEPAQSDDALEHQQIQGQLGVFLEKSPLLGDLFCQLMEADPSAAREVKVRWAARHKVTPRTIDNWRDRAASLFMVLYTGALAQLANSDVLQHALVCERDFNPKHPSPSALLPWRVLCAGQGIQRLEGQKQYRDAWRWMRNWMQDNGYPEADALSLPFQENHHAT